MTLTPLVCKSKHYELVIASIPALPQNEMIQHGGFLMAMGLNEHLANLGKLESFDFLKKKKANYDRL